MAPSMFVPVQWIILSNGKYMSINGVSSEHICILCLHLAFALFSWLQQADIKVSPPLGTNVNMNFLASLTVRGVTGTSRFGCQTLILLEKLMKLK